MFFGSCKKSHNKQSEFCMNQQNSLDTEQYCEAKSFQMWM
jgi:hypothetical protein